MFLSFFVYLFIYLYLYSDPTQNALHVGTTFLGMSIDFFCVAYTGVLDVSTVLAMFACKRKPLTVYLNINFGIFFRLTILDILKHTLLY